MGLPGKLPLKAVTMRESSAAIQAVASEASPDPTGSTALAPPPPAVELHCPLCDYSLRGLSPAENPMSGPEGRCPECGYTFEWARLLQAHLNRHRYLFEYKPRGNVRSFARTLAAGLRPRRFWTVLQPLHEPVVRRLVLYWVVIAAVTLLVGFGAGFLFDAVRLTIENREARAQQLPWLGGNNPWIVKQYGTVQTYLDRNWPMPPSRAFFDEVWRGRWSGDTRLPLATIMALWPAATFATLLIFVRSFKRARIRTAHVLRCAVYSADAYFWLALLLLLTSLAPTFRLTPLSGRGDGPELIFTLAVLAFAGVVLYRLNAALRLYLRFDRPFATALASQAIVFLAACVWLVQSGIARELFLSF